MKENAERKERREKNAERRECREKNAEKRTQRGENGSVAVAFVMLNPASKFLLLASSVRGATLAVAKPVRGYAFDRAEEHHHASDNESNDDLALLEMHLFASFEIVNAGDLLQERLADVNRILDSTCVRHDRCQYFREVAHHLGSAAGHDGGNVCDFKGAGHRESFIPLCSGFKFSPRRNRQK